MNTRKQLQEEYTSPPILIPSFNRFTSLLLPFSFLNTALMYIYYYY